MTRVLGVEPDRGDAASGAGDDVGLGDREDQDARRPGGQADVLRAVGRLDADDQVALERRVEPHDQPALAGRDGGQRGQCEAQDLAARGHGDGVRRRRQRRPRDFAATLTIALGRPGGLAVAVAAAPVLQLVRQEVLDQPWAGLGILARVGQAARVVADDADDVLLVLEGELLLDRLAVPGGHRDIVDPAVCRRCRGR